MENSKEVRDYMESKRITIGDLSEVKKPTVNISFALNKAWLIKDYELIEGFGFELTTDSFFYKEKDRKFFKENLDDKIWIVSNAGLTFNSIHFDYDRAFKLLKDLKKDREGVK